MIYETAETVSRNPRNGGSSVALRCADLIREGFSNLALSTKNALIYPERSGSVYAKLARRLKRVYSHVVSQALSGL